MNCGGPPDSGNRSPRQRITTRDSTSSRTGTPLKRPGLVDRNKEVESEKNLNLGQELTSDSTKYSYNIKNQYEYMDPTTGKTYDLTGFAQLIMDRIRENAISEAGQYATFLEQNSDFVKAHDPVKTSPAIVQDLMRLASTYAQWGGEIYYIPLSKIDSVWNIKVEPKDEYLIFKERKKNKK